MYHNINNNNNKIIFLLLLLTFITQIKAQQKTLDYNANCIKQNTNCYFNDPNIWSNKVVPALWDTIWLTSPSSIYVVFENVNVSLYTIAASSFVTVLISNSSVNFYSDISLKTSLFINNSSVSCSSLTGTTIELAGSTLKVSGTTNLSSNGKISKSSVFSSYYVYASSLDISESHFTVTYANVPTVFASGHSTRTSIYSLYATIALFTDISEFTGVTAITVEQYLVIRGCTSVEIQNLHIRDNTTVYYYPGVKNIIRSISSPFPSSSGTIMLYGAMKLEVGSIEYACKWVFCGDIDLYFEKGHFSFIEQCPGTVLNFHVQKNSVTFTEPITFTGHIYRNTGAYAWMYNNITITPKAGNCTFGGDGGVIGVMKGTFTCNGDLSFDMLSLGEAASVAADRIFISEIIAPSSHNTIHGDLFVSKLLFLNISTSSFVINGDLIYKGAVMQFMQFYNIITHPLLLVQGDIYMHLRVSFNIMNDEYADGKQLVIAETTSGELDVELTDINFINLNPYPRIDKLSYFTTSKKIILGERDFTGYLIGSIFIGTFLLIASFGYFYFMYRRYRSNLVISLIQQYEQQYEED